MPKRCSNVCGKYIRTKRQRTGIGYPKKRLLAIGEDRLVKAIDRYSLELQKDADWRKAQYGSTFFNSGYVDYLDENYVPGKATEHKGKSNAFSNINHRQYDYDELEKQVLNSQPGGG